MCDSHWDAFRYCSVPHDTASVRGAKAPTCAGENCRARDDALTVFLCCRLYGDRVGIESDEQEDGDDTTVWNSRRRIGPRDRVDRVFVVGEDHVDFDEH